MKTLILLATFVLVSGCATTASYERGLDSWIGSSAEKLFAQWGPPDQEFKSPNGDVFYTYNENAGSKSAIIYGKVVTKNKWCKTTFIVTQSTIKGWQHDGNACRAPASQ